MSQSSSPSLLEIRRKIFPSIKFRPVNTTRSVQMNLIKIKTENLFSYVVNGPDPEEHAHKESNHDDNWGSYHYSDDRTGQLADTNSDEEYITDSDEEYNRVWNQAEFQNLLSRLRTMGTDNNESVDAEMNYINTDYLSYEQLIELGEAIGTVSKGLPSHIIESMPLLNYKTNDVEDVSIDQCVICQIDYENDEEIAVLQCKHSYHPDCIKKWLQTNKVCPICNSEVSLPS